MAMFLVRLKANRGGATVRDGMDAAIVAAEDAEAARAAAAAGQPGGESAWADADAFPFDEANLNENGGVVRFQSTTGTPTEWAEFEE